MEEGNQSGDLPISGGHGNAQEEYGMRRRRRTSWARNKKVVRSAISQSRVVQRAIAAVFTGSAR